MVSLFRKKAKPKVASKLEDLTLRGFGGGLNVVDDDTNVEPKYQTTKVNFRRTTSGAMIIRYGDAWFADVAGTVTGNIVDMVYFNNKLVVVTSTGQIATVTDAGVKAKIWDSAIAALLPGAPAGWGAVTQVDFVPWKDQMILHDGTDKPIIISAGFVVTYLQDLGTGSNVNTPIGKYGCIAANYHCVAGIAGTPTIIYIGAKGTSGTFPGDPAPNDSISIDVGAFAPSGTAAILGIAGFRTKLIVFFRGQSLIITLGQYDNATTPNHVPAFDDEMPQAGMINHRTVVTVLNDLRFAGYDGLASAKRNLFAGNINATFLSSLVDPLWRRKFSLADVSSAFMVHNAIEHATYTFTNDDDGTVIVYEANEQLKYEAWTTYEGFKFVCGCTSFLGRVFLAGRVGALTRIYKLGNTVYAGEAYAADRINDRDLVWAQTTAYTAGQLLVGSIGPIEVNGGFENTPILWTTFGGALITKIDFFVGSRTGLKSLGMGRFATHNAESDPIPVTPASDYTLSGWFLGSSVSAAGITFGMLFYNISGVLLQTSLVSNDAAMTMAYVQKTATFTAPAAAASAVIFVQHTLTSTNLSAFGLLCDDITLASNSSNTSPYQVLLNHTSPGTGTFQDELVNHPTRFALWTGAPIDFEVELPWTDGRSPMRVKQNKFFSIDSRGTAAFVVEAFVDFQNPETTLPAVAFSFVGNDAISGARSNDPQLYEFPVKFKALKTRISGSTREPLTIASIKYLFQKGRFRR